MELLPQWLASFYYRIHLMLGYHLIRAGQLQVSRGGSGGSEALVKANITTERPVQ